MEFTVDLASKWVELKAPFDLKVPVPGSAVALRGYPTDDLATGIHSVVAKVTYTMGGVTETATLSSSFTISAPSVPTDEVVALYGTVVGVDHTPTRVVFDTALDDPVVVAFVATNNGPQPVEVRLSTVNASGFTMQLVEPSNLDGKHADETVHWFAVERGTHDLAGGTKLAAGVAPSGALSAAGFDDVGFGTTFDAPPIVLSQVQTTVEGGWLATRQRNETTSKVDLTIQEDEASNGGSHPTEAIGWIAIDEGVHDLGTTLLSAQSEPGIDGKMKRVGFDADFDDAPGFVAAVASYVAGDPVSRRADDTTAGGTDLRLQEDTSADAETAHAFETMSLLAFEGDGFVYG